MVVTVTETGTSRTETEIGKSHVTNKPYKLKFDDESAHFQPGLPYKGRLKVADSLIPLHEEVVQICYNVAIEKAWNIKDIGQCSNFTVGPDDAIEFAIPPLRDTVFTVNLYAKSLNRTAKQEWTGKLYADKYSDAVDAYFTLNRWFSPTKSYLQVERSSRAIAKCRSVQEFAVTYNSDKLRNVSQLTFFYLASTNLT